MTTSSMNRKRYIAVDFDGTLCEHRFPEIGLPRHEVIDVVRKLKSEGAVIIIWTCRSGEYIDPMVDWLREQGIPFDYINKNPECSFTNSPKIYADLYIDDRAYNPWA